MKVIRKNFLPEDLKLVYQELVTNFIAKLSTEEQTAIMGGNTIQFYNL